MRIVVAGGRNYQDKKAFDSKLNDVMQRFPDATLISGHARGADTLAEVYAAEHNVPIEVFKPEWNTFGRYAGLVRNRQMLEYAAREESPMLVAFWDGSSRGTLNSINIARDLGITVEIVEY